MVDNDPFTAEDEGDNDDESDGVTRDNNLASGPRHHLGHSLTMHHHFNPFQFHKGILEEGSYECTLNMPIIVTSREEYREGGVPALPDYETAVDEPPSYRAALQCLPPVPIYPKAITIVRCLQTNKMDDHFTLIACTTTSLVRDIGCIFTNACSTSLYSYEISSSCLKDKTTGLVGLGESSLKQV